MKQTHTLLTFPAIAASFGGAESVRLGKRFAWVKLPGHDRPVKIALSRLPAQGSMTSFNLAEAIQAEEKRCHESVKRWQIRRFGAARMANIYHTAETATGQRVNTKA